MHRKLLSLAAGICLAGVLPAWVQAAPVDKGIRVGAFTLSPFAGMAGTYDSNIQRASADEEDDVFLEANLGLKLGYQAKEVALNGIGFVQGRSYADHD